MADGFLGRWARRKAEVRAGHAVEEPPAPVPQAPPAQAHAPAPAAATAPVPAPAAEAPPPPTLEQARALTPQSDFTPFVARGVAPEVRNAAMKQLFADPHFNVMDGLDIYIGDYTQPDPLPVAMLQQLASAQFMGLVQPPEAPPPAQNAEGAAAKAEAAVRSSGGEAGADVAQSGVCNAIPSEIPSEPADPGAAPSGRADLPASHESHDDHADLRLQPDDAPGRESAGRGPA